MNFFWFLLALFFSYILYWDVLSLIIVLPGAQIMDLIRYPAKRTRRSRTRISLIPAFILNFTIGTLLPYAVFGMGMGVIALNFAEKASNHPVYFILAGLGAFIISASSRKTFLTERLISLSAYVTTVAIPELTLYGITTTSLAYITLWGLGLLILGGMVFGIVESLRDEINRKSKTKIRLRRRTNRGLSAGTYVLSIFFITLGMIWILGYLICPARELLVYFIWGAPYLVSGLAILTGKYWALRFSQVFLVLGTSLSILAIEIPIALLLAEKLGLQAVLFALAALLIFFGFPIWFLFKKSTINQFE